MCKPYTQIHSHWIPGYSSRQWQCVSRVLLSVCMCSHRLSTPAVDTAALRLLRLVLCVSTVCACSVWRHDMTRNTGMTTSRGEREHRGERDEVCTIVTVIINSTHFTREGLPLIRITVCIHTTNNHHAHTYLCCYSHSCRALEKRSVPGICVLSLYTQTVWCCAVVVCVGGLCSEPIHQTRPVLVSSEAARAQARMCQSVH